MNIKSKTSAREKSRVPCWSIAWRLIMLGALLAFVPVSSHAGVEGQSFGASYKGHDGAAEAGKDIADGNLKLMMFGLPMASIDEYCVLLKARLGITRQVIAGCVVSEDLIKYANDYNGVITKYVEKKFGAGILDKLMDEANQRYLKNHRDDETPPGKH